MWPWPQSGLSSPSDKAAVLSPSFTLYSSCAKVPLLSPRYSLKSSSKAQTKLFFLTDLQLWEFFFFWRLSVEFLKGVCPCLPALTRLCCCCPATGQNLDRGAFYSPAYAPPPTSLLHPCGAFFH